MTIQEKYDTFVRENHHAPTFATASIQWKDTDEIIDNLTFGLDSCPAEYVFFSTNGVYDLESLTHKNNGEDFIVMEDTVEFFYNKDYE